MKKKKLLKRVQDIKDFIGIYDGYIDEKLCKEILNLFKREDSFNRVFNRQTYHAVNKNQVSDKSANIWRDNIHAFRPEEVEFITINLRQALDHYLEETNILEYYKPFKSVDFTSIKIQKTSPGQGYHVFHVERKPNDSVSDARMLAFTIYLNDVKGGETEFLFQNRRVVPKTGRIAIWPANFPYVHRGNPPLDKDKFIVTSWMLLN